VGYGTPVTLEGERGSYKAGGKEYLITSRGNVKANWCREKEQAYVISRYTGKKHRIPMLKNVNSTDRFGKHSRAYRANGVLCLSFYMGTPMFWMPYAV